MIYMPVVFTSKYLCSILQHLSLLATGCQGALRNGDNAQRFFQYQYVINDALQNFQSVESLASADGGDHVLELSKVVVDAGAGAACIAFTIRSELEYRPSRLATSLATDRRARVPAPDVWSLVVRASARLLHGSRSFAFFSSGCG